MKFYLAPLEGITGYIFRNAFNEFFGDGVNKYFTPFLMPHVKRAFSEKELSGICPENNEGINLVPQILTNSAEDFTRLKNEIRSLGYEEINLNLGCPSGTVTAKGRGAAMLSDVQALDRFLDGIFADGDENISVKTRIGVSEPEEFRRILSVYIKYPIKELTIHPRVLEEMYRGKAHKDVFIDGCGQYDKPLCYNGDICSYEDYNALISELENAGVADKVGSVMIGRGALKNPSLIRELSGGQKATDSEMRAFFEKLKKDYLADFSGETPVLYKLKEIWGYVGTGYPDKEKLVKKLLKSKNISEYNTYVNAIFHK